MTAVQPKLECPSCKRSANAIEWLTPEHARCVFCRTEFDFIAFPALTKRRAEIRPRAVAVEEDASCFYHTTNQAEKMCEGCGRFLCTVCAVPVGDEIICPDCISRRQKSDVTAVPSRLLWPGICLVIAVLPMLMWPVTMVTGPIAVFIAFWGWKKPQSIVQPRRWPLILGGVIGTLQICAWSLLFFKLVTG